MADAFGVERDDLAKAVTPQQAGQERARHYRNMSGAMGAVGATSAGLATGSGIVGHMESKGKDPMGFAEKATVRSRVSPAKRAAILSENAAAHGAMKESLGVIGAGALGVAGAYKYKQRKQQQKLAALAKSLGPQGQKRTRQASDVGLGAASAGIGTLALTEGGKAAHTMNHHAKAVQAEALGARKAIAAHNSGASPLTPKALAFAQHQQSKGAKVFAVKKPAALAAGTIAAAGGAGLYELGRHAMATRRESTVASKRSDAFGVERPDLVDKRGVHVYDPDSPSSKAATKKHKGKFHPKFLHHMGAHRFDHTKEKDQGNTARSSKEPVDDEESKSDSKFPARKGHKPKKQLPAPFAEHFGKAVVAPAGTTPKKHPYLNSALNTAAVGGFVADRIKPGTSATDHLMRSSNAPKILGGQGKGTIPKGSRISTLGHPQLGTSAIGTGIHSGVTAEGNVGAKALKGAKAFGAAVPHSPGAAVTAGGIGAGLAIGAGIAHHRKQKALKAPSVPGVASKADTKDFNPHKSMKSQGMAFESKDGMRSAQRDMFANSHTILNGPRTKQNRKTMATHVGAGVGGGALVGGALGARRGGGVPGAVGGAATGAIVGGLVGDEVGSYKVRTKARKIAIDNAVQRGHVTSGHDKKSIGTFTGLKKSDTAPKKSNKGVYAGLGGGAAGYGAGAAVMNNDMRVARAIKRPAPQIKAAMNSGLPIGEHMNRLYARKAAAIAPKVRTAGEVGALTAAGTGLAVAGASALHNHKVKKSYPPPDVPEVWNRPMQFESERTVDGIPESQHASFMERLVPIEKNYYYGSAPARHHKEHPGGTGGTAAAFLGAASGAAAAPHLKKVKALGPKAKAVQAALKVK